MKTYKVQIKEKGNDHIINTSLRCEDSRDEQYVIDWFGLDNDDVEWYKISVVE